MTSNCVEQLGKAIPSHGVHDDVGSPKRDLQPPFPTTPRSNALCLAKYP